MKMYRCRAPNCGALLNESGYCARHQGMKPKPFANATRLNEDFYKSPRWKALRKRAIEAHPILSDMRMQRRASGSSYNTAQREQRVVF